jgi:PAS domain S-box-containing protein
MVLLLHVMTAMTREESRILMLVDDETARSVLTDTVEREGHRAIAVSRGDEALELLDREAPALFLVELPGPAGDDRMAVLSALQRRPLHPAPAIVGVTWPETHELRNSARGAGVIDFLSKPVDPVEVACTVHLLFELRRLRSRIGSCDTLRLPHRHCCNLVDAIADGISTIDVDDRLDFVNPAAAEMFGETIDQAVGRLVTDYVADERWKRELRAALERVRQGLVDRRELEVRRKDGTKMWITATGTPLYEAGRYVGAVVSFQDITSRRQIEASLRRSEQRLSLALAASQLGLWDWDLVADTAYLSPEYQRIVEAQETEVPAARAWFERLVHLDDRAAVFRTMDEHLRGNTPQSVVEYRARKSSGEFVWLRGVGRVVDRDRTGAPMRMTGVVMDISEHKHAEDRLRAAIEARDNVLAIASHDLKNPLSAIHLTAELLTERSREPDRRKSRRQLEVIRRSAAYMQHLVDNLLEAATMEAGTFTLNYASEELGPLLDELFQEFEPLAARKSIQLVRDVLTELPPIECDGTRLRETLSNLLGNALKFVRENGTIRLRSWAQGGEVHFEVADDGPGIPKPSLAHLFERYWKDDREGRRGAGLGLFISKGIVDAHHGQMFVESELGAGTRFHFTIPVKPGHVR